MTAAEVPHPHDFTDGDPLPHLRQALANGPPTYKDDTAPEVKDLATDLCSLNLVELTQLNYLICKKLGLDPNILAVIKGGLSSGGSSAAEEAPAAVDSGFRRVVLREVPKGVKERFPIMKLMRAEDEKLSLADCKKALESDPTVLFERIDKDKAEEICNKLSDMGLLGLAENVD
eukprot:CAMPEP_0117029524 /NCGR_PEP_ID=MMETSP0472-20121206/21374_1 /TAXON_ID=693140 ORGANISM="Tiarina fusus, Strain LIS" /NCGR_SAMPLE_ID=MMETSP0472 /ASSEMBLY_ACC=CAM_ASM_000603 /LENGTH=173 /DNA_ID=CAMNT_0004737319 /DNA_START=118 /DNA_END=639 /DNA_ORIENTATION=+